MPIAVAAAADADSAAADADIAAADADADDVAAAAADVIPLRQSLPVHGGGEMSDTGRSETLCSPNWFPQFRTGCTYE